MKSKENQVQEIEVALKQIEQCRGAAPEDQKNDIDLAIKYLNRAIENMDKQHDDRGAANTVLCGPKSNEEAEELGSNGLAFKIIMRLIG